MHRAIVPCCQNVSQQVISLLEYVILLLCYCWDPAPLTSLGPSIYGGLDPHLIQKLLRKRYLERFQI